MSDVKQVIVMRKDLKMRRGKEIAQGAHASMKWLAERGADEDRVVGNGGRWRRVYLSADEEAWLEGAFTKVCLQVESEWELFEIYNKAVVAGLTVHMITDAGVTEFNGVPTKTCLAIGPNKAERIDKITGHLKLY